MRVPVYMVYGGVFSRKFSVLRIGARMCLKVMIDGCPKGEL